MKVTPDSALCASPRAPLAGDDVEGDESWLDRYGWPTFFLALIVVTGMAFSLFWNPLFYHSPNWVTPADLWNTYRASQYVVWGGEGQIYNSPAAFQTFPGIAILLSPVAKVAGMLHLSESFAITLARPSTWWLLGPVQLALGATLLFPLDQWARRLRVSTHRRIVLLALEAALIWPSVALWGHPEDALSLTLALYGLLAVLEQRWLRFAVFFGLATLMQPLVLLVLPICLAYVPIKRWVSVAGAIALPSALALLAPLVQEWGPTSRLLLRQPNYFANNHPTPWASLAPVIEPRRATIVHALKYVKLPNGHHRAIEVATTAHAMPVVAAGPGRIVAIVIACALGFAVKRLAPTLPQIVWFASLSLSLRCVVEPVMVPYYLLPGLALALLVASATSKVRFTVVAVAAGSCAFASYWHLGEWSYYLLMIVPLALTLYVAWSATSTSSSHPFMTR
ncbi:MAG: hypothetical protein HIU57_05995 [Acidobacteria bacterium]|nr:hypothetical protein [Acidobacteriota bacterium]